MHNVTITLDIQQILLNFGCLLSYWEFYLVTATFLQIDRLLWVSVNFTNRPSPPHNTMKPCITSLFESAEFLGEHMSEASVSFKLHGTGIYQSLQVFLDVSCDCCSQSCLIFQQFLKKMFSHFLSTIH